MMKNFYINQLLNKHMSIYITSQFIEKEVNNLANFNLSAMSYYTRKKKISPTVYIQLLGKNTYAKVIKNKRAKISKYNKYKGKTKNSRLLRKTTLRIKKDIWLDLIVKFLWILITNYRNQIRNINVKTDCVTITIKNWTLVLPATFLKLNLIENRYKENIIISVNISFIGLDVNHKIYIMSIIKLLAPEDNKTIEKDDYF